jgi:hypothetical protein
MPGAAFALEGARRVETGVSVRLLSERKRSHLDLCAHEQVEHDGKSTLFDDVDLMHNALP